MIDHLAEIAVGGAAKQTGAGDHGLGAGGNQLLGASHAADAAADAARQLLGNAFDELVVVPARHGGVEIDELHLRELLESRNPAVEIVGRDGELVALNELDDTSALEINGRNQHGGLGLAAWGRVISLQARSAG